MPASRPTHFLMRYVTVGLIAAAVVVTFFPELLQRQAVVEVTQTGSGTPLPATSGPVSYADAVAKASPAVVSIHTAKVITRQRHPMLDDPVLRHFFGRGQSVPRRRLETSLGSGVIVSKQGYVLTNHHVVADADEVLVTLADDRSVPAEIIGSDPDTDLAVLKIDLDSPAITLGDSEHLRVGDVVLALGNPFGVGRTVTMGIVSATGRNRLGINTFEDFIQTDAAINPGNSGGALIDAMGNLVGINTAIYSKSGGSQGIGFAIPVSLAKGVMTQIIEHGAVVRGWLGVEVQDLTPALAESFDLEDTDGVLITGVLRGGPASRAGLEPGDVITHLDGIRTPDSLATLNVIARHRPGSGLKIEGIRKGRGFEGEAIVGQRPAEN